MPSQTRNPRTLASLGELALIQRIRGWFDQPETGARAGAIALGIGDDGAVVRTPPRTLLTTDTLVEDVHFRHATISARDLGWKALAVNVSDIAAMAGRPLAACLALSVPPRTPLSLLNGFFAGLRQATRAFACPLAGGDLTRAPRWMLNVTVLGAPLAGGPALRDAARPGDYVYVTGTPGESGAGLHALEAGESRPPRLVGRHRRPTPRLGEAALLRQAGRRLAMLDVSDGLFHDAGQLATASGVAVELRRDLLPVSAPLRKWCRWRGLDPLRFVLFGGEDYELLAALPLPPDRLLARWRGTPGLAPLTCIGRVAAGNGVWLLDAEGRPLEPTDLTFDHFAG